MYDQIIGVEWKDMIFLKSEWVNNCCLTPNNFSAISWRDQLNFQWDDDEVRFVLDQHSLLDFYNASPLKQQFAWFLVNQFLLLMLCA
jgi:hypothetical protein